MAADDDRRYYLRIGPQAGEGPYVRTYAGGNVKTTKKRRRALYWRDYELVLRLAAAIKKVQRVSARPVLVIRKGPFSRMSCDGRLLALKCRSCGSKMRGACIAPLCKPCGGVDSIVIKRTPRPNEVSPEEPPCGQSFKPASSAEPVHGVKPIAAHCEAFDAGDPERGTEQTWCKLQPDHAGNHHMASKCPGCGLFLGASWAVLGCTTMCIPCAYAKLPCPETPEPGQAGGRA